MQKIGSSTNTADANGEFTDGDPQKQIPCTWVMSAWLNTLQRELVHLCEEAGITIDPNDDTQIYQAIQELLKVKFDGLGTAAFKDIVTSMTDTTAGRVPVVGWMGLGGNNAPMSDAEIMSKDAIGSRLFVQGGGDTNKHFGTYGVGVHMLYGAGGDGKQRLTARLFIDSNGNMTVEWLGVNISDGSVASQKIQKLFGPLNPDTSRVAKAGDEMTGALTAPGFINKGDYSLRNPANRHVRFEYLKNDNSRAVDGYIYKDGVDAPNRRPGVRISCGTPDKDKGNTSNSGDWVFGEDGVLACPGQVVPANYTNFDEHYLKLTGGKLTGNLEINDNAPIIQFSEADTGKKYFIVVDGSGFRIDEDSTAGNSILSYAGASKQMKTAGQFVPTDYTNFDDRYKTKYPTQFRVGARVTYNGSDFSSHVPQGAVNINNYTNNDDRINGVVYAYLQYNLNGNWVNFA
ncbi:hypothetical protein [Enterobacter ludwigii]|uniref:hypothetical protein n=1 Tax=Enterobacter ludwigii TaxID=299767 RepID=UPI0030766D35